ncbi:hypothetical protein NQZ68_026488 [Dissostichus eleginoides]|nr:hypothetical protein NQZ68_026488 [Dissostichus eleginoides]
MSYFSTVHSPPAAFSSTSTSHLTSSTQPGFSIPPLLTTSTSHLTSTTQPGFSIPPLLTTSTSHLTSTTQPGFSIRPLLTLPLTPPPPHPPLLTPPPPSAHLASDPPPSIPPAEHTGLYHLTFDVPPLH